MNQSASSVLPSNRGGILRILSALYSMSVPVLAVLTAVIISSIFILLAGLDPFKAFQGLAEGALGNDVGWTLSLLRMAPYILSGLAVAFAFKGGLFNIGAQGQLVVGAIMSAWAGFDLAGFSRVLIGVVVTLVVWALAARLLSRTSKVRGIWPMLIGVLAGIVAMGAAIAGGISIPSLPPLLHVLVGLLAGILGGAVWGFIPGALKAYTGAHEVISTIMLNYIASSLLEWSVFPARPNAAPGPLAYCRTYPSCAIGQTPPIAPSAFLPVIYHPSGNASDVLHLGVFIAVVVALLTWVVLYRTTFGFELRMVGLNPNAARYSGINVPRLTILTMVISGGLAGLAGAIQTQGVYHQFQTNQSLTLGFDSIAVALLAGSNPIGIIPSALLFGILAAGSGRMQLASGVPVELIQVIQALILVFVAADQIVRYLYRIRAVSSAEKVKLSTGWGHR